jgi:vacuolar-type H+-ATPase subunit H
MLAYILSVALGAGSVGLFLTAFIAPKIHRKDDFLWTGLGLFYALVLWVCAARFTGGILLGQTAAVLLLLSFGWQMVKLRSAVANPEKLAELAEFSVTKSIGNLFKGKPKVNIAPTPPVAKVTETATEAMETAKETVTEAVDKATEKITAVVEETVEKVTDKAEELKEKAEESVTEAVNSATKKKSGFSLKGIFNKQKAGSFTDRVSTAFGDRPKPETKSSAKPIFDAEDDNEFEDLVNTQPEVTKPEPPAPEIKTEINQQPEPPKPEPEKSEPVAEVVVGEVVATTHDKIETEMTAVLENVTDKNETIEE